MRNLKKKVALLLALMMVLAMVPMNVFGAHGSVYTGAIPFTGTIDRDIEIRFPMSLVVGALQGRVGGGVTHSATSGAITGGGVLMPAVQLEIWTNADWAAPIQGNNITIPQVSGSVPAGINFGGLTGAPDGAHRRIFALTLPTSPDWNATARFVVPIRIQDPGASLSARLIVTRQTVAPLAVGSGDPPRTTAQNQVFGTTVVDLFTAVPLTTGRVEAADAAGQTGFTIGAASVANFTTFPTAEAIGNIVLTERSVGQWAIVAGNPAAAVGARTATEIGTPMVRLAAPAGYQWTNAPVAVTGSRGLQAGANTGIVPTLLNNAAGEVNGIMEIPFTMPVRVAEGEALAGVAGVLTVSGAHLIPRAGQPVVGQDLSIGVTLGNLVFPITAATDVPGTFTAIWGTGNQPAGALRADRWAGSVVAARQNIGGISLSVRGDAPSISSGLVQSGTTWLGAHLVVTEDGAGSFMGTPIVITIQTPGVSINGAQTIFYHYGANPWDGNGRHATDFTVNNATHAATTSFIRLADNSIMITNPWANQAGRRVVETRLQLEVDPNMGVDTEIVANVAIQGMFGLDASEVIATIVDPIVLTAEEPVAIEMREGLLDFLVAQPLAPVTVAASTTGRFAVDNYVEVYFFTQAGGVNFVDPIGDLRFAPVITATGMTVGERAPITTGLPEGAIQGFRWRINTAPAAMADRSLVINTTASGSLINQPGLELVLGFGGTAVAAVGAIDHPAYTATVAFVGAPVPVENGYDGPGDDGPGDVVIPEGPPAIPFDRTTVNSNGEVIVHEVDGEVFVGMRGLIELMPDQERASVTWRRDADGYQISTFMAPHAVSGDYSEITIITSPAGEREFEILVAGSPRNPRAVNFQIFGGSWFVPATTFQQIFGFTPNLLD